MPQVLTCPKHPTRPELKCPVCRATVPSRHTKPVSTAPQRTVSLPIITQDCVYLGEKLPGPCGTTLHRCNLDDIKCARVGTCIDAVRTCNTCTVRPVGARSHTWATSPAVRESHWKAVDEFLTRIPEYPNEFSGRGIVIAAGGKYWPGAYITVRMLRHWGCSLPVECWYLGDRGERDERYERFLGDLGAKCVDADTHPARSSRRVVNGFEVKLFAVLNSPFEEVLFLDSDCYPCVDPTPLFVEPRYYETGGVYWPDLPHTNAWTHWEHWGVSPSEKDRGCGLEVGQYVVNKKKVWKQLKLAEWYDDHSDWCYGAGAWSDHGDKGPHRVAWSKLDSQFTMYSTIAVWKGVAFVHPGPDGVTPAFVHRCRSKFMVDSDVKFTTTPQNGVNLRAGLPGEDVAFGFLEELRASL